MPNIYATISNVRIALGDDLLMKLLDVYDTSAIAANPVLAQKINWANSTIDGYLRSSVPLPLPGDPNDPSFFPDLVEHAANLVRWALIGRRPDVESDGDYRRYKDAVKFFENYSSNQAGIDLISEPHTHPTGAKVVRIGLQPDPVRIVNPCDPYLREY